MLKLITGDVLRCLARLPDESVQCVVTSPPYWGLRDYGTATWKGGDPDCDHKPSQEWISHNFNAKSGFGNSPATQSAAAIGRWYGKDGGCKCGARRIDAQIGLEPTPEAYVAKMVAVFAEVRRVLRPDGVCWVNLGDSYNSAASNQNGSGLDGLIRGGNRERGRNSRVFSGLKSKDLVGIPWRVAFALQADGWYLRSDIIWHKPNPMPESVRDRPTKAHEYVFLLTKRARYYYDADAVREPHREPWRGKGDPAKYGGSSDYRRGGPGVRTGTLNTADGNGAERVYNPAGRNVRSVWTITPKPFRGAHFATFPPQLVERCVKAGTSERGACPTCGTPWERVTERERPPDSVFTKRNRPNDGLIGGSHRDGVMVGCGSKLQNWLDAHPAVTSGFRPTCSCPAAEPVPCVVLDPFSGAGTVALVCKQLGRDSIGIDLNPAYNRMARRRIAACPRPA